jgi:hypothetical protein
VDLDPEGPPLDGVPAPYSLGAVYRRLGEREKTEQSLERAIQEDPKNENARRGLESLRKGTPAP